MKLNRIIKEGMFGDDVSFVQGVLKSMGIFKNNVSGFYGKETIQSVANIQRRNNFKVSGEVDVRTWSFLNENNVTNNTIELKVNKDNNIIYRDQNGLMISKNKNYNVSFFEEEISKNTLTIGEYRTIHKKESLLPHFIIERYTDVNIHKTTRIFDDKFWSKYITTNNISLRDQIKETINIELECVGPIYQNKDNNFYSMSGDKIDVNNIYIFKEGYQGYTYWGKYTDYQLETLEKLIEYLTNKWGINKSENIFDDSWFSVKPPNELGTIRNRRNIGLERGLTPQKKLLEVFKRIK